MNRSKWKRPFIENRLIKDLKKNNKKIKIALGNCEILPNFVGKSFYIYNGKNYTKIQVTNNMIGFKFGEFVFTRKKHIFKKKL